MAARSEAGAIPLVDPTINIDPAPSERQLGLTMATALIVGNMIGAGIFLLPALLAPFGQNAIYAWSLTIAGALFLAATFAILSAHIEGGPFVYVEKAFGREVAFVVMWSYLISVWTALAILPIAAVSNLSHIAPALGASIVAPAVSILLLWLMWLANASGARTAGIVQVATTVLKALPLVVVLVIAAIYFGRGTAAAEQSDVAASGGAIAAAAALCLFSMLGVECAAISADKVKNPRRNVPLASVLGAAITGVIYVGVTWAVFYLLPSAQAANSPSPFADAAQPFLGSIAGSAIAAFAAISALGCLNGWTLCAGEIPLKLARDGALPIWFGETTGLGTPVRAQVVGCTVATLLVVSNYSRSLAGLFAFITLISVVSTLVLYVGCTAAALTLLANRKIRSALLAICAAVGLVFSLWAFWGAGLEPSLWGLCLVATGIPVWLVARRGTRATGVTSYRAAAAASAPLE